MILKKLQSGKLLLFLLLLLMSPSCTFAHQPRLVGRPVITIPDPEISKAYYGELTGSLQIFRIHADRPFNLYLNLLEPDLKDQGKNTSAIVVRAGSPDSRPYAALDGNSHEWTRFWEKYGADWYWRGPEFKTRAEAGDYEIQVSNPANLGKFVLAVGEAERFDGQEVLNALRLIPLLKKDFFEVSPIQFIRSPFGWGTLLILYAAGLLIGFLAHRLVGKVRRAKKLKPEKMWPDEYRLLLAGLGICLLFWALATTWNLAVIFISGICLFEASGILSFSSHISRRKKP